MERYGTSDVPDPFACSMEAVGVVRLGGGLFRWHDHPSGRIAGRGFAWTRRRTGVSGFRRRSS
ncbi:MULTISPECIES: hypothetical protein, partial [unclassified Streptomyces]|uniref:hypothetical protein n=1 Tax=unclassified Streptomyces TaxID=2593676 RepID=UPI00227122F6